MEGPAAHPAEPKHTLERSLVDACHLASLVNPSVETIHSFAHFLCLTDLRIQMACQSCAHAAPCAIQWDVSSRNSAERLHALDLLAVGIAASPALGMTGHRASAAALGQT